MKNKDLRKIIFLILLFNTLFSCQKSGRKVTFANVCEEENHSIVEITGYLHLPNENNSNLVLLVENSDETGGFIQISDVGRGIISNADGVRITGEVLKEGNRCVLKIQKIETP